MSYVRTFDASNLFGRIGVRCVRPIVGEFEAPVTVVEPSVQHLLDERPHGPPGASFPLFRFVQVREGA